MIRIILLLILLLVVLRMLLLMRIPKNPKISTWDPGEAFKLYGRKNTKMRSLLEHKKEKRGK